MKIGIVLIFMFAAVGMNVSTKDKYPYDKRLKFVSILLTGCVVAFMAFKMEMTANSVVLMAMIPAIVVISFIDLKHLLIPDRLNGYLFTLSLIYAALNYEVAWILLLGGLVYFTLFYITALITGTLGMGDVKMSFSIGVILGFPLLLKFLVASLAIALLVSIALLATKKMKLDSKIAFGPYLAIGFIATIISIL